MPISNNSCSDSKAFLYTMISIHRMQQFFPVNYDTHSMWSIRRKDDQFFSSRSQVTPLTLHRHDLKKELEIKSLTLLTF